MTSSAEHHTGTLAKAAGSMSLAVLISRLLGLVREQVFAGLFGAGYAIDAFVVAFRIPNLLRDLFAEGALSTAFVTVFTAADQKLGPERTWRLANNVIIWLSMIVGLITIAGILASGFLVGFMAPDFGQIPGKLALTTVMTQVMFPFLLLISLAAVAMGILNAKGKFFLPALASSFFNLGSIVAGVSLSLLAPYFGIAPIVGMAWGTLIGGCLQLVVQLPLVFKAGYRPAWVLDWRDEGLRRIFILMLPAIVGLSATQINVFINTFYAASCMEGSVSWLNYAYRLVHLPQGLFGVALSVATLPVLSRFAADGDRVGLKAALSSSLSLAMLVTVPAALGLMALAQPICAVIFQHGRFTAFDTLQTAQALIYYSVGLLAFAAVKIIVPAFYALNDTRLPVLGSFLTVAANLLFINLTLGALGHRAIALSTSLSMVVNLLFLWVMIHLKLGGLPTRHLLDTLARTTAAGLIMAGAVHQAHAWLITLSGSGLAGQLLSLGAAILLGLFIYALVIKVLRVPAWQELANQMKRKLGKA